LISSLGLFAFLGVFIESNVATGLFPPRPFLGLALQLRIYLISESLDHHDSSWGSRDVGSID
jgi:hypothetical protein